MSLQTNCFVLVYLWIGLRFVYLRGANMNQALEQVQTKAPGGSGEPTGRRFSQRQEEGSASDEVQLTSPDEPDIISDDHLGRRGD